jgi:hypothetical protein
MKHTKEHQKEKHWWVSLAYALGRLRVRSLAPLEKTRGFGKTPTGGVHAAFQTDFMKVSAPSN